MTTQSATFLFGDPIHDDDGTLIELFRNGLLVATGIALHEGKGQEDTTRRAVRAARDTWRGVKTARRIARRMRLS